VFDKLGTVGLAGVLVTLVGIGIVAWRAPVVAAGIAVTLAGVGLIVRGLVGTVMQSFGLA
jgi:hypothetical protein